MFKKIMTTVAILLFMSVIAVPNESASLSTFLLWGVWCVSALFIANLIFKRLEDEED